MDEPARIAGMTEQDRQISEIVAEQRSRLRNFIRRRVPNPSDAEDIVQEVFYELLEANHLLMPIEHLTGWLFRVARNRIIDLLRKKKPKAFSDAAVEGEGGEMLHIEDLLPSPDAGPEALYLRNVLHDELELALDELPQEQHDVFVTHELEGRSFQGDGRRHWSERECAALAQTLCGAASLRAITKRVRRIYERMRI
jgi:RNA polymerase sigma factor (sigma-70 family)